MRDLPGHDMKSRCSRFWLPDVALASLCCAGAPHRRVRSLESFFSVRPAAFFQKGWLVNLGWNFINSLTPIFLLGPPAALLAWMVHAVLPASFTGAAANLPLWARMVAAMIVGEIGFYWGHCWSHEIPLLRRFRAVHHSASHVNFLVS
jgi:sterol desaturase/sphingolipid hydroxylase (fatty acid hydroxylase superfamily)